jgi:hypothetical protein
MTVVPAVVTFPYVLVGLSLISSALGWISIQGFQPFIDSGLMLEGKFRLALLGGLLGMLAWMLVGTYRRSRLAFLLSLGCSVLWALLMVDVGNHVVTAVAGFIVKGQLPQPVALPERTSVWLGPLVVLVFSAITTAQFALTFVGAVDGLLRWVPMRRALEAHGRNGAGDIFAEFSSRVRESRQSFRSYNFGKLYLFIGTVVALYFAYIGLDWLRAQFVIRVLGGVPDGSSAAEDIKFWNDNPTVWAGFVFSTVSFFVALAATARVALRAAWRRVRRSAEDVLADHDYRPAVFLRSFRDEDADVVPRNLFAAIIRRRHRLEEVLARVMTRLGPAVAIGQPGESAPRLGALRAYFADADWQGAVARWVERASYVVVMAGTSRSVLWELRHLAERGAIPRLLLVIPPDATTAERLRRWTAVRQALDATGWGFALQAVQSDRLLCVVFEPAGDIVAISGDSRYQVDYEIVMQIAVVRASEWCRT